MRALTTLILFIAAMPVWAESYAVVVSHQSKIDVISAARVQDIFLKKRRFAGDVKVVPVNILSGSPARMAFENMVLQMDRSEVQRYWTESHFRGVSPPITQASFQSIKKFVENVDGAVGYVPLELVDPSLRVVHEF